MTDIGQKLEASQRPVLICGTDIVRETTPGIAADLALFLMAMTERTGLFYILPGPNAFGAALLSPAGEPVPIIEAIEGGDIKALMLMECDPFTLFPDRARLEKALDRLDLLLVMDYVPSQAVNRAHIVLPTTTVFEGTESRFVNQEGRLQVASPVYAGGVPIAQISDKRHPPRIFLRDVPGGESRPPSDILRDLFATMTGRSEGAPVNDLWIRPAEENPFFNKILSATEAEEGVRFIPDERPEEGFRATGSVPVKGEDIPAGHLELLLVDNILGTEELSRYSRIIPQGEKYPRLQMHREDARSLSLADGVRVSLNLDGTSLEAALQVLENMAPGVMILPRLRQLDWPGMENWRMLVPMKAIKGVE